MAQAKVTLYSLSWQQELTYGLSFICKGRKNTFDPWPRQAWGKASARLQEQSKHPMDCLEWSHHNPAALHLHHHFWLRKTNYEFVVISTRNFCQAREATLGENKQTNPPQYHSGEDCKSLGSQVNASEHRTWMRLKMFLPCPARWSRSFLQLSCLHCHIL